MLRRQSHPLSYDGNGDVVLGVVVVVIGDSVVVVTIVVGGVVIVIVVASDDDGVVSVCTVGVYAIPSQYAALHTEKLEAQLYITIVPILSDHMHVYGN
jgi:hypothetical protein